jgi:hypothetical protein
VTPGDTLQVNVGGRGADGLDSGAGGAGGFNGGAAGGSGCCGGAGGGGGASDVRSGAFGLADRIMVAGGGGGAGGFAGGAGGVGGGLSGGNGVDCFAEGGGGGTSSQGGAGGSTFESESELGNNGVDGDLGTGGAGGDGFSGGDGGGGGGGGYYGGGGGGAWLCGAGGGGGSGFGPSGVIFQSGVRSGDGLVTITYTTPDTTPPTLTVGHTTDGTNGWNKTSPVTVNVSASDTGSGLAADPTCTDGANGLTLTAGSTAGTWTTIVSGDGTHTISCSVTDKAGNQTTASDTVMIDTKAPSVSGCSVDPSTLRTSANNHKLVTVTATAPTVTDSSGGSGANGFTLLSVTSSQADSGLGTGDVPNDIQGWTTGTNDTSGQLRAERYGGTRTYTLIYEGKDVAGNTATCQATVTVPKGG